MSNYVNPYLNYGQNPYAPNYPSYQQPQQQVVKVNGENGARAFQIGANSSAILLDETGTLIWLITTDGAGYKTVTPYDISPHKVTPPFDMSSIETRISRLEEIVNGNTANLATIKRKNSTKSNDSTDASTD